jgi:hypothetical protein
MPLKILAGFSPLTRNGVFQQALQARRLGTIANRLHRLLKNSSRWEEERSLAAKAARDDNGVSAFSARLKVVP